MAVFDGSGAVEDHVLVIEIDQTVEEQPYVNHSPFTWKTSFNTFKQNQVFNYGAGCFGFGSYGNGGTANLGVQYGDVEIKSVIVEGVTYTEAASIALVEATAERWFYDQGTLTLYLHHTNDLRPSLIGSPVLGAVQKYANKAVYIDNVYHRARVKGDFTTKKSRDPAALLIITHDLTSIKLDNTDGFFDQFNEPVPQIGQPVRAFIGLAGAPFSDFLQIGASYIEDITVLQTDLDLKLLDTKKKLSRELPLYTFDDIEFPDLNPNNLGKPKQLPYSTLFQVPCICLNEDEVAPSNYEFLVGDVTDYIGGIRDIVTAYVDGESKTINQRKLVQGTFILSTANYSPGQVVTIDCVGLGTLNLIARGDCEDTNHPLILNELVASLSNCTFARSSVQAKSGTYSYLLTKTGASCVARFQDSSDNTDMHFLSQDETYTLAVWFYVPSTGGMLPSEVVLRLGDYQSGWEYTTASPAGTDAWERVEVTRTIRSSATGTTQNVQILDAATNSEIVYVDEVQHEIASSASTFILREKWDNPLRLIEHLQEEYSDIEFNATNYDLTEWEAAVIDSNVKTCAILIDDDTKVIKAIEKIISTVGLGTFMQLDNGKWTMRIFDSSTAVSATITSDQILGLWRFGYDKNVVTKTVIKYRRNWEAGTFARVTDDSEETDRLTDFKKHNAMIRETMIPGETEATEMAALLLDYFGNRRMAFFEISMQLVGQDIMDQINVQLDRIDSVVHGTDKYEILEIEKNLTQNKIRVIGRQVV